MNVEIGTEALNPFLGIFRIFDILSLQCMTSLLFLSTPIFKALHFSKIVSQYGNMFLSGKRYNLKDLHTVYFFTVFRLRHKTYSMYVYYTYISD
jgi:hypothetical protein